METISVVVIIASYRFEDSGLRLLVLYSAWFFPAGVLWFSPLLENQHLI